ncbi:hypothetical protein F4811DRAFT_417148 [Daldinia bambusicola]|nr:hypothetical protein F4811DRAFT_417148 [Daldinia bambusicola]
MLGVAFESETHANLVLFRDLPVEAPGHALQTKEMSNLESLSLGIDKIRGSAQGVVCAVSNPRSLRHLYCFQQPA